MRKQPRQAREKAKGARRYGCESGRVETANRKGASKK